MDAWQKNRISAETQLSSAHKLKASHTTELKVQLWKRFFRPALVSTEPSKTINVGKIK